MYEYSGQTENAGLDEFEERVVAEHILVLSLHHIVALRAHLRDLTEYVDRTSAAREPLELTVQCDEQTGPPDASAAISEYCTVNLS